MSNSKEINYTNKSREISGVQFSILSPQEIKDRSVVHVRETILYDNNGDPLVNGLFDTRMGVIDHGTICPTDGLDNRFCPGYFGHIELARPVFQIQFLDMIMFTLKTTCIKCSRILLEVTDELIEMLSSLTNKQRNSYVSTNVSKGKTCFYCGSLQPNKFIKEGVAKLFAIWKNLNIDTINTEDKKQHLNVEFVLKHFRRITDDDCYIMGFDPKWCRPDWFICINLPVPPPAVRPSIKQSNNTRSEDDITHKLIDILKTNNHLKKKMDLESSLENTIEEWTSVLQYHCATLIDNNLPGISPSSHRSGRPLKTIRERLKGKEGRIRGNLMGKRVDHCARSVITPDPNIKINELGVPFKVAKNLTFPEIVNKYNIAKLTKCVRNGPYKHPGAKSIYKKRDKRTTSLLHVDTSTIELFEGDIVHRHLIDGDPVLFNRQPSLHKMSMMAHNVRVMDYNTFRLNVSVTTPYNADFDGDEMNMHVPQSIQTAIELQSLAAVPLQIISPRVHTPIITLVQDTLLGINRITNDGVYINRNDVMNIFMYIETFTGILPEPILKNPDRWSGRQLLSMILPDDLNLNMKNDSHNDTDEDKLNHVIIKNGKILQGRLDKKIMNTGSRGIIHMIFNDYGHERAQQFLDDIQNIITRYLVITGFSVGISDLIADKTTNDKIIKTIVQQKKDVSKLVQQLHTQSFDKSKDSNISESFEKDVNNILNKAIAEAGKIGLTSLDPNNRMTNMVSAGSKGKSINIAQMIACLGQQNIDGKRIPNGYNDRTLPHFSKYDVSPNAKGFVENSFIKGLSPEEFFFHAMGGREGLIDTAVKTSETGYIQRKLIKAMEDLKTHYDLSVRNADGNIIQFVYGEDGFDYCKIETQFLDYLKDTYEQLEDKHKFEEDENWNIILNNTTLKEMSLTNNYKDILNNYYKELLEDYKLINEYIFNTYNDSTIHAPINMFRLIKNAQNKYKLIGTNLSNLNPVYIIQEITKLLNSLYINKHSECNKLFKILIKSYLSPKILLKTHKLNKNAFDFIIAQIHKKFEIVKIETNEMVGPIAAQSIGEPATQMTLNTFHFAGVAEKSNVTRGVPRLKELLHLSKSLKSPSLSIFLKDDISNDKNKAKKILTSLEITKLGNILKTINIYYDPDDFNTLIEEDKELLQIYKMLNDIDEVMVDPDCSSKWIIRLEMDKDKMLNKDITMELIYHQIKMYYTKTDDISCIYTDDNSNKLIFRIRLKIKKQSEATKMNDLNYLKSLIKTLQDKIIIKGVENINSVSMFKSKKNVIKNNSYVKEEEWVLDTNGINLVEILQNKSVDKNRTISNDIYEIYDMYGIEAARNILINELREVISSAGSYVNYRHISLLADIMTNKGILMSIDRFGINRGNIGPLAKCSFEETTDQLFKASIFGELDKLNGVSSNIMMGQVAPCGTGTAEVFLDESKLMDLIYKDDEQIGDIETWEQKEDYCDQNIGIDFDVSNLEANNNLNIPLVSYK